LRNDFSQSSLLLVHSALRSELSLVSFDELHRRRLAQINARIKGSPAKRNRWAIREKSKVDVARTISFTFTSPRHDPSITTSRRNGSFERSTKSQQQQGGIQRFITFISPASSLPSFSSRLDDRCTGTSMDSTNGDPNHRTKIDTAEATKTGECDSEGNREASEFGGESGGSTRNVSIS